MRRGDWTNRKGGGLGLLVAALGFAVPAYLSRSIWLSVVAAFLALAGIVVLGIDFSSRRKAALFVEASVDYLYNVVNASKHLSISGFDKRKFAVLKVTNTGSKDLKKIIAKCQMDQEAEENGIWSLDSGDEFTGGGSHKADLDVGDSRLLVVAQGFGADKLWARLPRQKPFGWPPRATDLKGTVAYVAEGQILSIASDAAITVRFTSKDLRRVAKRFRLDFDGDEPRITPFGMAPQHHLSAKDRLHEWERTVANPRITLSNPFMEGNRLLLRVHNHGASADFFAKLRIDGLMRSQPEGQVFCRWNHKDKYTVALPNEVPFDLFLAVLKAPGLKGRWFVQYISGNDVLGETEHQRSFYPGTPAPAGPVLIKDLAKLDAELKMTPREFLQGELEKPSLPDDYRGQCEKELARLALLPEEVTSKRSVAEAEALLSIDICSESSCEVQTAVQLTGPSFRVVPYSPEVRPS
jgi:hypothetical protein